MSRSHNKKRNVGIIYEFLLRNISDSLISGDKSSAQNALKIIEKRFDKDTELYKEFRLFNALAKSTVSDSAVAAAILTEAKHAARRCDTAALDKEKSLLIRDINHKLSDSSFYHRRLPEYTVYATIQTLLNDWRMGDRANLSRVIQYESKVVEQLLSKKNEAVIEEMKNPDVNDLVVNIMSEKINKKYGNKMNSEQKIILQEYVFSLKEDGNDRIKSKLSDIIERSASSLSSYKKKTDNVVILEKIDRVDEKIKNINLENIDDESISKVLVLMNLKNEIKGALK